MTGTEVSAQVRASLGEAVERLRDACTAGAVPAPQPALLLDEITRVAGMLEARLAGGPEPHLPAEQADRVAILDALRARTLEAWREGEGGDLLATMRAFEEVRARLAPGDRDGPLPPGILSPYGHRLLREVAHTLRSPMGSVVMLAATLRDAAGDELTAMQRKHLGLVHRASTTLAAMANDLLALTGELQELHAAPVPFSVVDVVDAVAGSIGPVAEERGVELRADASDVGVRVGRSGALTRALMGLTLNAALLVREGSVSLSAAAVGDEVRFRVEASEATERADEILEVFPSPPGTSDYTLSHRGLGFGLARHLVRRMGSELAVENGEGRGVALSFALMLPPSG